MIAHTFQDAFSAEWVKIHLPNRHHDLVILRQLIPWQPIIDDLVPLYNPKTGRHGCDLRTLSAVSILARLRDLAYVRHSCNLFRETCVPVNNTNKNKHLCDNRLRYVHAVRKSSVFRPSFDMPILTGKSGQNYIRKTLSD